MDIWCKCYFGLIYVGYDKCFFVFFSGLICVSEIFCILM